MERLSVASRDGDGEESGGPPADATAAVVHENQAMEPMWEGNGQTVHALLKHGQCVLRINATKGRVICGFCSKETTRKHAWRHIANHGASKGMRQQVLAFLEEHLRVEESEQDHSERVEGLGTGQGFACDVCQHGYSNINSFKHHSRRGCPGNAVPATLQPQLVGRQRRLVPVESDDPPTANANGVGESVSVESLMRLVQENINGIGPGLGDVSIKDAFHSEVKWDRFLVVGGSFDAAMQLRTPVPVALRRVCQDWLKANVSQLWEEDHMLKRAVMRVR